MQKLQDFLMSLLGVETEPTFIPIFTLIRKMIIKDNHDTLSRKSVWVGVHIIFFNFAIRLCTCFVWS